MRLPAATDDFDPERTREDDAVLTTAAPAGGLGRGSVLAGKYRLEMLLGQGGMACVWSAYHLELELPVAVKLLRSGPKPELLAKRLRLEARAAARLIHPSIVRVHDVVVTADGDPFIVMELLSGESLAQVLARERLSAVRAVQLLLPIAEALVVAHAHGIVHRDLKPGNVFLSKEGRDLQPKLLDFGIAKLEHASLVKLTEKGIVLGSPNYMSPEQVRGDDVDYRSDIWSFCVLLYKALTGGLPFKGSTPSAIMHEILNSDPAPAPADSRVDSGLSQLILAGLSKDAAQRPRSMRELGTQLAQWLLAQGVSRDACGVPLTSKWLAPAPNPCAESAPALTIDGERTLSARRNRGKRSPPRHGLLLAAAAASLVIGTLAWADSAPAPGPARATPMRLAAAQARPASRAEPLLETESVTENERVNVETASPSPAPVPSTPASKPKPRVSARKHVARAPQLPF